MNDKHVGICRFGALPFVIVLISACQGFEDSMFDEARKYEHEITPACYIHSSTTELTFLAQKGRLTTPEYCVKTCESRWFGFCGVQNGNECWCGNRLDSLVRTEESQCKQKLCLGNQNLFCGGKDRLWVMSTNYALGHYQDVQKCWNVDYDDLSHFPAYSGERNSREFCRQLCGTIRSKYAATENGRICRCGDNFFGTTMLPMSKCNKRCSGDTKSTCGGRLAIFMMNSEIADHDLSVRVAEGCYKIQLHYWDFSDEHFDLTHGQHMDQDLCKNRCSKKGKPISVMWEDGGCKCGKKVPNHKAYLRDEEYCNLPCPGNTTQRCGVKNHAYVMSTISTDLRSPIVP